MVFPLFADSENSFPHFFCHLCQNLRIDPKGNFPCPGNPLFSHFFADISGCLRSPDSYQSSYFHLFNPFSFLSVLVCLIVYPLFPQKKRGYSASLRPHSRGHHTKTGCSLLQYERAVPKRNPADPVDRYGHRITDISQERKSSGRQPLLTVRGKDMAGGHIRSSQLLRLDGFPDTVHRGADAGEILQVFLLLPSIQRGR